MDNLRELMGHIDYFFQNIPSQYKTDVKFEVYLKDKRWTVKDTGDNSVFGTTDHNVVLDHLIEVNADLKVLHGLVHSNICTEGVLRKLQLKKCADLVGIESIDSHEEAWSKFAENLGSIIRKEIGDDEKPCLTLVEDE